VSLVARYLEAHGIPTVVFATARDIVEHCGVARLVHADFPLGNPCGEPFRADMQREIVELGLGLLETATAPRTTVTAPFAWSGGDGWKARIFSQEQPFLDEEAQARWLEAKQQYKVLKARGEL